METAFESDSQLIVMFATALMSSHSTTKEKITKGSNFQKMIQQQQSMFSKLETVLNEQKAIMDAIGALLQISASLQAQMLEKISNFLKNKNFIKIYKLFYKIKYAYK